MNHRHIASHVSRSTHFSCVRTKSFRSLIVITVRMNCISPGCPYPVQEGGNVYDYKCVHCGVNYCLKCLYEAHFPVTCEERRRWVNERRFEEDQGPVVYCEESLDLLYQLSDQSNQANNTLLRDCATAFLAFPNLSNLNSEMQTIISFLKWLQVLFCFNPRLVPILGASYSALFSSIEALYYVFPVPLNSNWRFSVERVSVAAAMVGVLQTLGATGHEDRILPGSDIGSYSVFFPQAINYELARWGPNFLLSVVRMNCISAGCSYPVQEGVNIYDYKCVLCRANYCLKCVHEAHFPVTCEERRRWVDERTFEEDQDRVVNCEQSLVLLNQLSYRSNRANNMLLGDCPTAFFAFPNLSNLNYEMQTIISFLKWVQILFCFNPRLVPIVGASYSVLYSSIEALYHVFPLPSSRNWRFSAERVSVAAAMVGVLQTLGATGHEDRILPWSDIGSYSLFFPLAINYELARWGPNFPVETVQDPPRRPRSDDICCICLHSLLVQCRDCIEGRTRYCQLVVGECGHGYHSHCLYPWLRPNGLICAYRCPWRAGDYINL